MIKTIKNLFKNANKYKFKNSWEIKAPLKPVWNEIINYNNWPDWCYGVQEVKNIDENTIDIRKGNRFSSVWKGTLPYTLTFDAKITNLIPYTFISFKVHGDLKGVGVCRLSSKNGITTVNFIWNVSPAKTWMILLAPIAKPLFVRNHNRIVDSGLKELRTLIVNKHLAVQ